MSPTRLLRRLLWPAFALSIVAAVYVTLREDSTLTPTNPPRTNTSAQHSQTTPATDDSEPPLALAEKGNKSKVTDIFAVRTWEPPPPPPPKPGPPPPPPQPQAPPLPFKFLGRIVDADRADAFLLAIQDRVLSVSVGDTIEDRYLLEKFAGGQLHFLYRPLNIRQTLTVGSAE